MFQHRHSFELQSSINCLHMHEVSGITEPGSGFCLYHFHRFSGVSSYLDHTHKIIGKTGCAIKTKNGHIHKIYCELKTNKGHRHQLFGYTLEEVEYRQNPSQATITNIIM